jgi:hypothetical protein
MQNAHQFFGECATSATSEWREVGLFSEYDGVKMPQATEVRIPPNWSMRNSRRSPIQGLELVSAAYLDHLRTAQAARELTERECRCKEAGGVAIGLAKLMDSVREALKAVELPQKVNLG